MKLILCAKLNYQPADRIPDGKYFAVIEEGKKWLFRMKLIKNGDQIASMESEFDGASGLRRAVQQSSKEGSNEIFLVTENFHHAHKIIQNFAGNDFDVEYAEESASFPS